MRSTKTTTTTTTNKQTNKQTVTPCLLRKRQRKESGTSTEQLATNCGYSWCPWLSSWMVLGVVGRNLSSPTAGTSLWTSMWRGRPGHQPASQTTGCSIYRLRFAGQTAAQFAEFSWPSITEAGTWTSPGYTLMCQGADNRRLFRFPPPPSSLSPFSFSLSLSISLSQALSLP